ncbi:hypothetical protein CDL12_20096 [Handroanthus impetiginosus]|uniref:Ubiquitin-like protease family profile domain-containing protein n=1 Tax=Handroanthus impetiginosus TaxID=429701 RepID=A0A2G9GQ15_9LAMI|nr:hypothetical protein CDL12_20096 [Handroanthus impetiginosus]
MRILCSPLYRENYGHEIWSIDTFVMILSQLEKRHKKRVLKLDEFDSFLGTMMASARKMLEKLTLDVLDSNRFIIMPLNSKNHWYLLVFDTVEKKFTHMNSLWSPQSKGMANVFAKFISGFLFHSCGYEIEKPKVYCRKSRQQIGSLDCGMYMCLWAKAFAQSTKEYWAYAENCVIDGHRTKMAATIMEHEGGLLYKEVN